MIRRLMRGAVLVAVPVLATLWWLPPTPPDAFNPRKPDLANGREMLLAGGCSSCHASPDQPDKMRLGGGLALRTAFATFHVPNISPDATNGIGGWSEVQFVAALTAGVSPQGKHYYPAFPYTSYRRMTVDDQRDLFAYLKILPAVKGRAGEHELHFPYNIRRLVGLWKLLFLDGGPFKPDPARSVLWNRGAYLVNGVGHCAECHSSRNIFGAVIASSRFTGGASPDGRGGVPNITRAKLKDWSEADIAHTLLDGTTPDADKVGGNMLEVVRNTSQMTAEDRAAIAAYIKSLPAREGQGP